MSEYRWTYHDLETRSPVPIKNGTHAYLEHAEVMLWAFVDGDGTPLVWDLMSGSVWTEADDADWRELPLVKPDDAPTALTSILDDPTALIAFQNGGMFDFPVLLAKQPELIGLVPMERWRDTMVLAYLHSLPGALEKYGALLEFAEGERKLADEGHKYINLFCKPRKDGGWNDRSTHPEEWRGFVAYAARDIVTMRRGRQTFPRWNDTPRQWELWRMNLRMNYRGFAVDLALADAAIEATDGAKATMAEEVYDITNGAVQAATQRDKLLVWLLETYGVPLPDMRADTLERRLNDPELPLEVKDLLRIRLRASMNSSAKYKTVKRAVSRDGRVRGTDQFRGAGRTGRDAHRLTQPGNMMRPTLPWEVIRGCIAAFKSNAIEVVWDNTMEAAANCVRSVIVPARGMKFCVADLSNIEGRVGAWLACEETTLEDFRKFDRGEGPDMYVVAYAKSFNVAFAVVIENKKHGDGMMRQIGKVQELMFLFGGGVGAWITGAATYGIDLVKMTAQVFDTLPEWAVAEAAGYLTRIYEEQDTKRKARLRKAILRHKKGPDAPDFVPMPTQEQHDRDFETTKRAIEDQFEADKVKARFGLDEKVFICCDALKRLWRAARPKTVSYWRELEDAIRYAIANPRQTFRARRLRIRVSGKWLRIVLPSGRELCYPNIDVNADGRITYTGQNQYSKKWERIVTYGGKIFENCVQAVANDQFLCGVESAEKDGYLPVLLVHDEDVAEVPDRPEFTSERLAEHLCVRTTWNEGLPLAAAGEDMDRYHKAA